MLPWADYRDGFGSTTSIFWLGLERLHLLTSSEPYRLRAEMLSRDSGRWYSMEYWTFRVDNEANKYRLEISGFSGDEAIVNIDENNGMMFTTIDQDNDLNAQDNCTITQSGGWWFNDCQPYCLACNFLYHTVGDLLRCNESRMMIKRREI